MGSPGLLDKLVAERRLSAQQKARVEDHAARGGGSPEDGLIELGLMEEGELLKLVSTLHRTKFVSTATLAKAGADRAALAKVPAKIAQRAGAFPVAWDSVGHALTVVAMDPSNVTLMDDVKAAAGARTLNVWVARPAAVLAAIQKHYLGQGTAFAVLLRPPAASGEAIQVPALERGSERMVEKAPDRSTDRASSPVLDLTLPTDPTGGTGGTSPSKTGARSAAAASPVVSREYLETLNVLISLVEHGRPQLRGHSSQVARLMKRICERIGLGPVQTAQFVVAAYLHDLGKAGGYHLTALNVSSYDNHRVAAQKAVELPVQIMDSVGLDAEVRGAVVSMYERFDGAGFPAGAVAKDVPLGARLLAIVDSYADLTQNPRNPYRKVLRPAEACQVLQQHKATIFDPGLVEMFVSTVTGDGMRTKLLSERTLVLVIDPDPEEASVLTLRLEEHGFEVRVARNVQEARPSLADKDLAVVVSELDLDTPGQGLTLCEEVLKSRRLVWVFLTSNTDRALSQKAFELGIEDFIVKPAMADLVASKIRRFAERNTKGKARGVSGSLAEMPLPEMVQVLWHGRKTCALRVRGTSVRGELYFDEGKIVHASTETLKGDEAAYALLAVTQGEFELDPAGRTSEKTIQESPEGVLLEAMRRMDESKSRG